MGKRLKHKRISQISPKGRGGKIPAAPEIPEDTVCFSFKHVDLTSNEKFGIAQCGDPAGYIEKLVHRLRDINGMTPNQFRFSGSDALRCHPIEWKKTSEKNGFRHLNKQLQDNSPWQFSVSANEYGRVHGFFVNSTFFIVWLDPKHRLYLGT